MKYLIGIDGGGTKTKCVVTDLLLAKQFECFGGPSNFLIIGTETVCDTLLKLIDQSKEALKCGYEDFAAIVLGTTGAGRRNDAETLEKAFAEFTEKKGIKINCFRVESDARIALEGAFSGRPGSILIAGTGSIMFGKDAAGNIHRVGGFGRFIGDEGSGYSIGKLGLTAVSKYFDGRCAESALAGIITEKFGITSQEILITQVYKNNFDIASVAPCVLQAAEKGDAECIKIIEQQTDELVLHISAMAKKIAEAVLSVSFIGGIICNPNIFSDMFKKKIKAELPNVKITGPDLTPEMGAVVLAKNLLG